MATLEDKFGIALLDPTLDWIRRNMKPEDIFDRADLAEWAQGNLSGFRDPEDIFSARELEEWAEANGYEFKY